MSRFTQFFSHAFAVTPFPEKSLGPLPDTLKAFAHKVTNMGMETPAILFLETAKPLSFLAGQTLLAFNPVASPFFSGDLEEAGKALEDKRTVQQLIEYIEELSKER